MAAENLEQVAQRLGHDIKVEIQGAMGAENELSAGDTGSVDDAIEAVPELREQGFERVLASLAPDGVVLVTAEDAVHEPARECEVVDTVGAGDALLSGLSRRPGRRPG